jgi:hypothetical protein
LDAFQKRFKDAAYIPPTAPRSGKARRRTARSVLEARHGNLGRLLKSFFWIFDFRRKYHDMVDIYLWLRYNISVALYCAFVFELDGALKEDPK